MGTLQENSHDDSCSRIRDVPYRCRSFVIGQTHRAKMASCLSGCWSIKIQVTARRAGRLDWSLGEAASGVQASAALLSHHLGVTVAPNVRCVRPAHVLQPIIENRQKKFRALSSRREEFRIAACCPRRQLDLKLSDFFGDSCCAVL